MFDEYGRDAKITTIALLVVALIPLVVAAVVLPQMADQVPMRFDSSGEVLRWGSRWELLIVPAVALIFGVASVAYGRMQAKKHTESETMARMVYVRNVRSGLVLAVFLNIANVYMLCLSAGIVGPFLF
jgi:uncharacterized membrane protein